jgi:hypothetical protein
MISGCAGPHFDITRQIGMFPPTLDERDDFYEDAKKRCESFAKLKTDTDKAKATAECIRYWEAVLWAQDYRSYVGARAAWNRNIIYLGGALALASAGALVGLAAFGQTTSDAYKLIPIAGTFLGGLLSYSKNDALYETYETTGMKIDQALRDAENKIVKQSETEYLEAAAALRRDVGSAVSALTQTKIDIVKFQSKSEADQFKAVRDATAERDLALFQVAKIQTDIAAGGLNPKKIIATLNSAPDPQKLPIGELRLRLTDVSTGKITVLHISAVSSADVTADIPNELQDHGPRTYRVEVQARNGDYTIRNGSPVTLTYANVRLDVTITGTGTVTYTDSSKTISCPLPCETGLVPRGTVTQLTATPSGGLTHIDWKNAPACGPDQFNCPVTPSDDMKVEATFH